MRIGVIETDWERNIHRVSPFLGVLLIAAFAFFVFTVIRSAMQDLTQAVHTEAPLDVSGTIRLTTTQPTYGEDISFRSTIEGAHEGTMSYISTACFQGDKLVYQRTVQQGVSLYLVDQSDRDLEWDGKAASCSATLMYRTVGAGKVDVYILDALSFDVKGRSPA